MIKYTRSLLREWSVYGQLVEVVGKVGSKTDIIIKEIHTAKVLVLVLASMPSSWKNLREYS